MNAGRDYAPRTEAVARLAKAGRAMPPRHRGYEEVRVGYTRAGLVRRRG